MNIQEIMKFINIDKILSVMSIFGSKYKYIYEDKRFSIYFKKLNKDTIGLLVLIVAKYNRKKYFVLDFFIFNTNNKEEALYLFFNALSDPNLYSRFCLQNCQCCNEKLVKQTIEIIDHHHDKSYYELNNELNNNLNKYILNKNK